jgi:predicted nucleic acid-binding Zn ribbon protein
MPTYLYETVPAGPGDEIERFEVKQSFSDAPLVSHPATGQPVRRVISGGLGLMTKSSAGDSLPEPGPGCGPGTCGCGRFS